MPQTKDGFLSKLFEDSPCGILVADETARIIKANPAAQAMFGYSGKEFAALRVHDILAPGSVHLADKYFAGLEPDAGFIVLDHKRKSGEIFPVELGARKTTHNGRPALIGMLRDISMHSGNARILAANRVAAASAKDQRLESLDIIAGGLAHDFNNMLAGIMGNLSLLEMDLTGSKKKKLLAYVAEALEGVNSCRNLMRQFSAFAKGARPSRKRFNLCSTVSRAAALAMTGADCALSVKTPETLPDIEGDEGQVFQTVNNIVLNAAQAMPAGGTVTVELSEFECREGCALPLAPGRYIRIDISDSGIGMPADVLARIFDPYFSTKGKGRGLGLAMAFSVARGHGGHIEAASEQGKGTRFSVYLPCLEVYSPCARIRTTRPKLRKGSGLVLVLEDDGSVTEMLTAMLRASGYTPVPAADGRTALRLFREKGGAGAFKAVIMDLVIPGGMGGKECLKELRKQDPAVAAVATSGYSDYLVMAGPEKHGFDSALPKPYSSEEFGNALSAALEKAAARSRGGAKIRKRSKK